MKKTYEAGTTQGFMMTNLTINGKSTAIKFNDGYDRPSVLRCRYTTDDKNVQDAIEKTKLFVNGFIKCIKAVGEPISEGIYNTEGDLPKKIVPEEPEKPEIEPKELNYSSLQQVANWLVLNRGINIETLNTPEAIKKCAAEQNLRLPKIK
jgi:hypothetical protein